jgi:hypothetical protein
MSNLITVQPCQFIDYDLQGVETDKHWGYRIYDDYGTDYYNLYGSLEEVLEAVSPQNVLTLIANNHYEFYEYASEHGLVIGGEWFSADDDELAPAREEDD